MFDNQQFIAKTLHGLENVLAEELAELGATEITTLKRAVRFTGDTRLLYRANLELRTALRVLVPIHRFEARSERQFYEGMQAVNWSFWMEVSQTLATDAVGTSEFFPNSHYLSLLAKDAIVDQFRERVGRRPNVRVEAPDLRVHIHFFGEKITVCLDSSDESLHLRGWRKEAVAAPLNEVLAAGLLRLAGWTPGRPLLDPMCGSGTLLIEAAMWASRTPSQICRENFGFFRWKKFDKNLWKDVVAAAQKKRQVVDCQLVGFDKEQQARNISRVNTMTADGISRLITFDKKDFEKLAPPVFAEPKPELKGPGVYNLSKPKAPLFMEKIGSEPAEKLAAAIPTGPMMIFNPPYDERLKIDDIQAFYAMIGERLKHHWPGWEAWIISSNKDALNSIGLKPSKKITLFNGGLECWFQKYEMYEGKRRTGGETQAMS